MAEIRHACADGLTPECFAKYPQYAKKVFAYRLMHTMCPARMTTKLREALWKALIRVPVSWIPFDQFIFPDDFDWSLVFPDDWTPEDPVPSCVIVEPGAEFPADWRPGDELPPGVTIDLSKILPPYWQTADSLPFGITVDPTYRIQIPELKLMYIFIRPGETWESVFPNGWDPTGPLPDGASWNPYLVFPDYVPAVTPADKSGAEAPLYLPPWSAGPVHRPAVWQPPEEAGQWETWAGPDVYTNHPWYCYPSVCICDAPIIDSEHLVFDCDNPTSGVSAGNIFRWDATADTKKPQAGALTLQIQVTANVSSDLDWGGVCLEIRDLTTFKRIYIYFAKADNYEMGANDVFIGDNGGEPMEIDFAVYGIMTIDRLQIIANVDMIEYAGHADYNINYINFV